jgi:hypothetical protein
VRLKTLATNNSGTCSQWAKAQDFRAGGGPGAGQQPEGIGQLGRQQPQGHRQHKHHQQRIGRGGE